jgi:hypothetical protein
MELVLSTLVWRQAQCSHPLPWWRSMNPNVFSSGFHVFLRVFQSVQIVLHVFKDGLLWISGITEFYRARVLLDIYHVSVPLAPRCPESCFTITRSANKTKSSSFLNFGRFMCEKN